MLFRSKCRRSRRWRRVIPSPDTNGSSCWPVLSVPTTILLLYAFPRMLSDDLLFSFPSLSFVPLTSFARPLPSSLFSLPLFAHQGSWPIRPQRRRSLESSSPTSPSSASSCIGCWNVVGAAALCFHPSMDFVVFSSSLPGGYRKAPSSFIVRPLGGSWLKGVVRPSVHVDNPTPSCISIFALAIWVCQIGAV